MDSSLLMASAGGPLQNVSIFDPASPPAESIRNLSVLVLAITGLIFVIVEGVLFYSVLRFRRRTTAVTTEPPQVYGSKPIEIAWTAAPALVVFMLMLVTTRTLWEIHPTPPQPQANDNTLFVTVIGRQWWWEYHYDHFNGKQVGLITANELHIPASDDNLSRPVYLTLQSADVCHSFWVPRLAGKIDLIPGRDNHLWFQSTKLGVYVGQCAEYCGTQHANMLLRVTVDPPKVFESWLESERKPAVVDAAAAEDQAAFVRQSCITCHRVRGTAAQGTYGPDLTHLMSRRTLASGMIANNLTNLRDWVNDPQKIKPGCLMPAFGLNEQERDQIVRYLLTLR